MDKIFYDTMINANFKANGILMILLPIDGGGRVRVKKLIFCLFEPLTPTLSRSGERENPFLLKSF
jgi:hypothetical protein